MVKQVKHLRTHRKGPRRGLKFRAGSKPLGKPLPAVRPVSGNVFAVLQRPVAFKKLMKHFLIEVILKFTPSGAKMIGMDPANVALIEVIFKAGPNGTFASIRKQESIPVNIMTILAPFKNAKKDEVWFFAKEGNNLLLTSPVGKFTVPLIEIEDKEPVTKESLDKIAAGAKFSVGVNSHDFTRAIADADAVAESIVFISKSDGIDFTAKGDLTGSEGFLPGVTNGGKAKAKYSIEYLKKLKPMVELFENINLRFADDFVLKITAGTDLANLMFILAPRVDSEESASVEEKPEEVKS